MIEDVNKIIREDVGFTNINVHKYWIPLTYLPIFEDTMDFGLYI